MPDSRAAPAPRPRPAPEARRAAPSETVALELGALEAALPPSVALGKQHRSTKSPTAPEVTPPEPGDEP